jgi:acyl-coenzyme A thioesterase PaaI-like protein
MGSVIVGLSDAQYLPVTVSLSTDFIRPVPIGKVFGEGRVTSKSDKSAFLEAKITDSEGTILARATGFYRIYPFQAMVKRNHD